MSSELIREAIRHAEVKQASQLQIALAADSRAMTLCVSTAAIASVLVGIIANMSDKTAAFPVVLTAALFFVASCYAAWSARPIGFSAPGQDFSDFKEDILSKRDVDAVLIELGGQLDEMAAHNEGCAKRNAKWFKRSLIVAASAPWIGLAAGFFFK